MSGQLITRASLVLAGIAFAAVLAAGLPVLFGRDSFVVTGGSMAPAIRPGALVVSERVAPEKIIPGDVITFRRADRASVAVTHRVIGVRHAEDGTPIFRTKGDSNASADPEEVSGELPISRMSYMIPYAGFLLHFATTGFGKVILVVMPAIGLIVLSITTARRAIEQRAQTDAQDRRQRATVQRMTRDAGLPEPVHTRPIAPQRAQRAGQRPARPGWTMPKLNIPGFQISRGPQSKSTGSLVPRPVPSDPGEMGSQWVAKLSTELNRQTAALDQIQENVGRETNPVARLFEEHQAIADLLRSNIAQKLVPLNEYADTLEADLEDLKSRLGDANDVAAPLRPYFDEQRRRVVETRLQVERLSRPLEDYLKAQEQAIEAIFIPFEGEVRAVEDGLTDQLRILKRMLAGMRSDQFENALDFMTGRLGELRALAEAGASDPASIAASLHVTVGRAAELKRDSLYLGPMLDALDGADLRAAAVRAADRILAEVPTDTGTPQREPYVA